MATMFIKTRSLTISASRHIVVTYRRVQMSVTCKIKVEFDMILLFSFVNIRQNGNTHKMRNGNALAIQIHLIQYSGIILLCVTKENLNNNSHPNSQKCFFVIQPRYTPLLFGKNSIY